MNLRDIIIHDAALVAATHYVNVASVYGTVEIRPLSGDEGEVIFMQGDDAAAFISEGDRLWNELGDVTKHDVWLFLAKPYVECLS